MKKHDLIDSIDKINPTENQKSRMFKNVINGVDVNTKTSFNYKRIVTAYMTAVVVLGVIVAYPLIKRSEIGIRENDTATGISSTTDGRAIGTDNNNDMVQNEGTHEIDTAVDGSGEYANTKSEDMVFPIEYVFMMDRKEYGIIAEDKLFALGFSSTVDDKDIGETITTIKPNPDAEFIDTSLVGCKVYEYKPAKSQAIVVVEKDGKNTLYEFSSFFSYQKNSDEDASEYLKIYNIKSADDIAKIELTSYSKTNGNRTLKNMTEIESFYNEFKKLKNSSKEYFDMLYGYRGIERTAPSLSEPVHYAEDLPATNGDLPVTDTPAGATSNAVDPGAATSGSAGFGTNALANSMSIRIYTNSGLYLETVYYPNIKFISRYKISNEFAAFLNAIDK